MGYSTYVGRVGALAVALGIGVSVATSPGPAWADPDPASANDTTDTATSGTDPEDAPNGGTGTDETNPTAPSGAMTTEVTSDTVTSSGEPGQDPRTGVVVSTGGAQLSGGAPGADPEPDPPTRTPESTPEPPVAAPPTQPDRSDNAIPAGTPPGSTPRALVTASTQQQRTATTPPPALRVQSAVQPATAAISSASVSRDPVGTTSVAVVSPSTVSPGTVSPRVDPIAAIVTPVVSLAAGLLSFAGLLPSLVDGPAMPVDPPLLWVVLGFVRREIQQSLFNSTPTIAFGTVQTSQSAAGVITGTVTAADAENDPLAYSVVTGPRNGTVTVDPATGRYVYTPNDDLAATGGVDTFTLSVVEANSAAHFHGPVQGILAAIFGGDRGDAAVADVTVTVSAVAANDAPSADGPPTVGYPDRDGAVSGALNVTDGDGDRLTYGIATPPASGTVTVDPVTGIYTYRPSDAARLAATLTTDTVETDGFGISVTDGRHSPIFVTVTDVPIAELPVNSPIAVVAVGNTPSAVVVSGSRAYVANSGDDTVSVLRTSDDSTVMTVAVGDRPVSLALSGDGSVLYVANGGDRTVTAVDTQTGAVLETYRLGDSEPTGIAASPNGAYVYTSNLDSTIAVITLATGVVSKTPIDPISIVSNSTGTRLYSLNQEAGVLTVTTAVPDENGLLEELYSMPVGDSPWGIAVSPDDAYLYISNTGDDSVWVIRTDDYTHVVVDVGDEPKGLAVTPDGGRVYVADYADDTVSIIDTTDGYRVVTVPVGDGPLSIDIDAAGTEATVTNSLGDNYTVLTLLGNGVPVVSPEITSTDPLTGVVQGALNAADPDGDALIYAVTTNGAQGSVVLGTNGSFTYTPDDAARQLAATTPGIDVDTFTVTVVDSRGAGVTRVVEVEIAPTETVNNAPQAAPTSGAANAVDGAVAGSVNASDPDGDPVTVTRATNGRFGNAVVNADGTFTYTPSAAIRAFAALTPEVETDTFTVTLVDSRGATSTASVTVEISPNAAPTVSSVVDSPVDGVVTGRVIGTDPDGGTPRYVVRTQPVNGVVTIDGDTGDFTFTPNAVARAAAAATPGIDYAGFVVEVSDGRGAATMSSVHVVLAPTRVVQQATTTSSVAGTVFSPDGSRVVVTSASGNTTEIRVYDTATGAQLGNTTTVAGSRNFGASLAGVQFSSDGTRAIQTIVDDSTSTTRLAVIDTTTGVQLGDTVAVAGLNPSGQASFSENTTRAVVFVSDSFYNSTSVVLLNTAAGGQVGTTFTAATGAGANVHFSDDAGRVAVVTRTLTEPDVATLVVLDTTTGAQLGTAYSIAGSAVMSHITPDGTRVVLSAHRSPRFGGPGSNTVEVAVIDAETGALVNPSHLYTFQGGSSRATSADGQYVAVATSDTYQESAITTVAVIDTSTGQEVGTASVAGPIAGGLWFTADDSRLIVSSGLAGGFGPPGTTRLASFDPDTVAQIGTTLQTTGRIHLSTNGSGTLTAVTTVTQAPDATTSVVQIFNAVTGETVDVPGTFAGSANASFVRDDTRLLLLSSAYDSATDTTTSLTAVVDVGTGDQLGDTVSVADVNSPAFTVSADGRVAIVSVPTSGLTETRFVIVDLESGRQVGSTFTSTGGPFGEEGVRITGDGARGFVTTYTTTGANSYDTRLSALDLITGTRVGQTVTLTGDLRASQFGDDEQRIAFRTRTYDPSLGMATTRVSVFNTADGSQVGSTLAFEGEGAFAFNPDDVHGTAVTSKPEGALTVTTVTVVHIGPDYVPAAAATTSPASTGGSGETDVSDHGNVSLTV